MTWLAALGWLRSAFRAVVGLCTRYPLQCALIASLLACGWLWHGKRKAEANLTAAYAAWDQAKAQQQALRATERADYERKADAADEGYRAALAGARDDTARYVAAHRVRAQGGGCAPVAIGQADPAGIRPDVSADSLVAVSEPDVRACSDATAYAVKLREWALGITVP